MNDANSPQAAEPAPSAPQIVATPAAAKPGNFALVRVVVTSIEPDGTCHCEVAEGQTKSQYRPAFTCHASQLLASVMMNAPQAAADRPKPAEAK